MQRPKTQRPSMPSTESDAPSDLQNAIQGWGSPYLLHLQPPPHKNPHDFPHKNPHNAPQHLYRHHHLLEEALERQYHMLCDCGCGGSHTRGPVSPRKKSSNVQERAKRKLSMSMQKKEHSFFGWSVCPCAVARAKEVKDSHRNICLAGLCWRSSSTHVGRGAWLCGVESPKCNAL